MPNVVSVDDEGKAVECGAVTAENLYIATEHLTVMAPSIPTIETGPMKLAMRLGRLYNHRTCKP